MKALTLFLLLVPSLLFGAEGDLTLTRENAAGAYRPADIAPPAGDGWLSWDNATKLPVWRTDAQLISDLGLGTGAMATDAIWDAAGDTVYGTGANTAARLAIGTAGQVLKVNGAGTAPEWGMVAGSGPWTDADPVLLGTTTRDVVVGAAAINAAKLSIDGDANQVQFAIQGHAGQSASLIELEDSAGTVVFSVDPSGTVVGNIFQSESGAGFTLYQNGTVLIDNGMTDWELTFPAFTTTLAGLAGTQTFTGQKEFSFGPRIVPADMGVGTTFTLNTHHFKTISANTTFSAIPTGTDGDFFWLVLEVTGATRTVDFHTNSTVYREGGDGTALAAALSYPIGLHRLYGCKADGKWILTDTSVDAETPYTFWKADAAGAVGFSLMIAGDIPNDLIDSQHYAAASIANEHLADNAVGNAEMADNAVGNAEMADNAVGNAEMADDAVDSAEIADGAIDMAHLSSAVTAKLIRSVTAQWAGNGAAITTGKATGYATVPYAGTIVGWSISSTTGATCTITTWKIADGTAVPTIANVISTAGVSLSANTHVRSSTVTDFTTTAVAANDILAFDLTAVAGSPSEITFKLLIQP